MKFFSWIFSGLLLAVCGGAAIAAMSGGIVTFTPGSLNLGGGDRPGEGFFVSGYGW